MTVAPPQGPAALAEEKQTLLILGPAGLVSGGNPNATLDLLSMVAIVAVFSGSLANRGEAAPIQ